MNTLPINAFPIAANATKSSGFALAIVVGLALFLSSQKKPSQSN